jgi:hypothetical protein
MAILRSFVFGFIALLLAAAAQAQLTIYDEALVNGFQNYSYGGVAGDFDFASTLQAHGGTKSIRFVGDDFNAVSLARPGGAVTTVAYPALHFWAHGGASGGQHLRLYLQFNGAVVANASLDSYIVNGPLAANAWREVIVPFGTAPLSYSGSFDRIDLQSDVAGAQAALFLDDVSIGPVPAQATPPMVIEHDVAVASIASDRFTWRDSAGLPRVASLAHNDGVAVNGSHGGALREFRYQLPDGATRVASVTTYNNGGYGGFGYVVAHASNYAGCVGDDSPLGSGISGTWSRVFEGRHHAIFRFTQNYPRNCSTSNVQARTIPIVIDWMFATGRDNPLWAITWNVDQAAPSAPVGTFFDDSRAPYGELNIDGDGSTDISGVAWGDRFKFTSTTAPVTLNSDWTWNVANSIPYVKLWINGPLVMPNRTGDATMGIVQTQTMTQQDAGGGRDPNYHDLTQFWGKTSADGNAGDGYKMPWQNEWAYQANADSIGAGPGNNARLTWRTQWGFLGQQTYVVNDGVVASAPGYPKKSYSTYVVLGTHSSAPVEAQVTQVETVQSLTLTINGGIGSVVTSGPAGVTRADIVTYAPAGYNHVYGALAFNATGNALDANIAVGSGTLSKPVIIVGNYTGGDPQSVRLGGAILTADVDYFASTRSAPNELWLTLNRNLTGATNRLEISTTSLAAPAAFTATATSTTQVTLAWSAAAGAATYEVYRSVNNSAFAFLTSTAATTIPDAGLTANTTYLYKVRSVNGGVTSAFTAIDPATTTIFTDDPLSAGTTMKVVHLTQLRTAVNAMRTAAGLGAAAFTDPALAAGTVIKAVHVTELRTALDQARAAIGLTALVYTDPTITAGTTKPKAAHITDLRAGVK